MPVSYMKIQGQEGTRPLDTNAHWSCD